jgi:hypothetical protein
MTYPELRAFATSIKPGDHQTAYSFLNQLAITLREEKSLKPHERRYLYRLRGIWRTRAEGKDARWDKYGCRAGAIPKERPATPAECLNIMREGRVLEPSAGIGKVATANYPAEDFVFERPESDPFTDAREGFERETQRVNDQAEELSRFPLHSERAGAPAGAAAPTRSVDESTGHSPVAASFDKPTQSAPRSRLADILGKY